MNSKKKLKLGKTSIITLDAKKYSSVKGGLKGVTSECTFAGCPGPTTIQPTMPTTDPTPLTMEC